ncbi:MAG TPA: hypothetical protein PLD20_06415 [Blastocatellia bacterium]|nr:hypothetical protein [Blastocatellia bacterium]HMY73947.1 hypothetical protein [Blastocatellia bacterium]HMZ17541.1 hypothetical protein [Blastocatellia bacterium]
MLFASTRSNRSLFVPETSASPRNGVFQHIAGLSQLGRLDFEHFAVAGEVIFKVEGDTAPTSQQEEEARIGTLAYALKKLGNATDAAEFSRCLNAICAEGDARGRQATASHYFREMTERGTNLVLKEMALLAMQLAQLNPQEWTEEEESCVDFSEDLTECVNTSCDGDDDEADGFHRSFFDAEIEAMTRQLRGRRKFTTFARENTKDWVGELEANDASVGELDAAFETLEALEQYDEGGAILVMSGYERTTACGKVDAEWVEEDLPECARHLAIELRRAFANGVPLEELWEDLNAQVEVLFPVSGKTANGGRFYSHASREWQRLAREILEALLAECQSDFHLVALRTCQSYRQFHKAVRGATDTRKISETMKQAYKARLAGTLPLKHFTTLNTAAQLQRIRLQAAPLSRTAISLLKEIERASQSKLRFLRWAMYGNNQPQHPVHQLSGQETEKIWETLKRKSVKVYARAA